MIVQFEKALSYQLNLQDLYGTRTCILSNRSDFPSDIDELCDYIRSLLSFPIKAQKERKSAKVVFEILREKFYDLGIYVFKDSFKVVLTKAHCTRMGSLPLTNSMSPCPMSFSAPSQSKII